MFPRNRNLSQSTFNNINNVFKEITNKPILISIKESRVYKIYNNNIQDITIEMFVPNNDCVITNYLLKRECNLI